MRRFKTKINAITCLLQIMFILLPIVSIMMVHFITMAKTLQNMDMGFFGKSKTYLLMHEKSYDYGQEVSARDLKRSVGFGEIYGTLKRNGIDAAISKNVDAAGNIQLFCYTSSYANLPMLSGRFFEASDFTSDNYAAVVGKDLKNKIYDLNGTSYIDVNGKKYKVIGVMGYFGYTPYDSVILINGAVDSENCIEKIISIDIFEENHPAALKNFKAAINAELNLFGDPIASGTTGSSGILTEAVYGHWFIFILLCDIISLLILSIEWVNRNKRNAAIKRMLGCSDSEILCEICLHYGAMLIISAAVSLVYCKVVFNTYFRYLFYGFGYFILIIIPLMLFLVKRLMKTSIEEAIK